MMKYLISGIAIAFINISCSHGITRDFPKGENLTNPTEIVVIRNWNFICGGQSTKIILDQVPIAHLRLGDYATVFVEPGWHSFEAEPFLGKAGYFREYFEKGKKHYLLISLIFFKECEANIIDLFFGTDSCPPPPICEFEIERISEEKGLKRIKRSRNLIEMEKTSESEADGYAIADTRLSN